jgi:hypothetical protein
MPKELQPHTAVPAWDSMSPGEKQAWLLGQALDCKREILTMPLPDPSDDSIEAHRIRALVLLGYSQIVRGHVGSIARGINVPNAQANQQGLASVNPIFTWVRLAQRIPVRIHIDEVPGGVVLAAGMTATAQINPRPQSQAK